MNTLSQIQAQLKVPKSQYNEFGKYNFRSAEDIIEAVKAIANPLGFYIICTDRLVLVGSRIYVEATATLSNGTETYQATASAREDESLKGMQGAQITGSASSYARKYALNGLFAIDDTKDADSTNKGEDKPKQPRETAKPSTELSWLNPNTDNWNHAVNRMKETKGSASPVTIEVIKKNFRISKENEKKLIEETK